MSVDRFPYRFVATGGRYEGTTFIYLGDGRVISYQTDSPAHYFEAGPDAVGGWLRDMTPEVLAWFTAIPERGSEGLS